MHNIIINNIKKFLLLPIVVILYSNLVMASSMDVASDIGILTLTIKNRPPVITSIYFSPNDAFEDTALKCMALINDENPNEVRLNYKWYINNALVETNNNYLADFKENDLIRCEVTPIDNEDVLGETKSVFVTINKKLGLSSITAFFVKNSNINILAIFNLLF